MNADYAPFDLLVIGLVIYRVTRFIVLDTLIEGMRDKLIDRLERKQSLLREKLVELIGCPYCASIWVSAGAIAAYHNDWVADFVWYWLATATVALIVWSFIDSEETVVVKSAKKGSR